MKLFIASHSQSAALSLKTQLERERHVIVARWITDDTKFQSGLTAYTDEERSSLATMDEQDVRAADALVLIAEPDGRTVPGGKHVETGIAIGLGKPVFVVGRKENLFHWHPRVTVVESAEALSRVLSSIAL